MTIEEFRRQLIRQLSEIHARTGRTAVAFVAGPPAAGKSTLARLTESDSKGGAFPVQALQMDGFHYTNGYLKSHFFTRRGRKTPLSAIKGAPETFDLEALTGAIKGIRSGETRAFPVYDREKHEPVADAVTLTAGGVVIEGNYLLLDRPGWRELRQYADITVCVTAPSTLIERRLIRRKLRAGRSFREARRFTLESDMKNAALIKKCSLPADYTLSEDAEGRFTIS